MKRLVWILLCLLLSIGLVSCSNSATPAEEPKNETDETPQKLNLQAKH